MADNFLLFSTELVGLSQEELNWVDARLKELEKEDIWEDHYFQHAVIRQEKTVWLYSEEYASPDGVANFIQEFIKRFRPDMKFTFGWAETCSKPRVGEFGGGACGVSADEIVWVVPEEEALKKLEEG